MNSKNTTPKHAAPAAGINTARPALDIHVIDSSIKKEREIECKLNFVVENWITNIDFY